jgi:anti-sigma-K factor RskA
MSQTDDHDEMAELVAVYALDALDGADAVAVEAHLATCADCRALLDQHLETAAMLAELAGTEEPPSFDRLASVIAEPPPPLRSLPGGRGREPADPPRSSSTWRRPMMLAAAAAVVLALGLGALLGSLGSSSTSSLSQVADAAGRSAGARHITLAGTGGAPKVKVVLTSSGQGFVRDSQLSSLDAAHTYQLWAVVDGSAISLGVLGSDPTTAAFRLPKGTSTLAVTAEVAGGVVKSTHTPVASATLT